MERRHGVQSDVIKNELKKLVKDKAVLKISFKGSVSYRDVEQKHARPSTQKLASSTSTRAVAKQDTPAPLDTDEGLEGRSRRGGPGRPGRGSGLIRGAKTKTIALENESLAVEKLEAGSEEKDGEKVEESVETEEEEELDEETSEENDVGNDDEENEETDKEIKSRLMEKSTAAEVLAKSPAGGVSTVTLATGDTGSVNENDAHLSLTPQPEREEVHSVEGKPDEASVEITGDEEPGKGVMSGKKSRSAAGAQNKHSKQQSKKSHNVQDPVDQGSAPKRPRLDPGVSTDVTVKVSTPATTTASDETCDFCLLTSERNPHGKQEQLLVCKDCEARAHPSCMDYTEELAARASRSPWQCMDCKTCNVCNDSGDADAMLFCDACDKGFHMNCHTPPIKDKPSGKWVCCQCLLELGSDAKKFNDADDEDVVDVKKEVKLEESDVDLNKNFLSQPPRTVDAAVSVTLNIPTPSASPVHFHTQPSDKEPGDTTISKLPCPKLNHTGDVTSLTTENDLSQTNDTTPHSSAGTVSDDMPVSVSQRIPRLSTTLVGEVPDASDWTVHDVTQFFVRLGFVQQASAFSDQEIDGKALLLMTRSDVLTGLSLKLGPALKIYAHIQRLQSSCTR